MVSPVIWIFIAILIIGAVIFGLMRTGYIKSDYSGASSNNPNPNDVVNPVGNNNALSGGKRRKSVETKNQQQ